MSILVRREQDKFVFRMKTAVNHDTAKLQAGAEISTFEVPSLEGSSIEYGGVRTV